MRVDIKNAIDRCAKDHCPTVLCDGKKVGVILEYSEHCDVEPQDPDHVIAHVPMLSHSELTFWPTEPEAWRDLLVAGEWHHTTWEIPQGHGGSVRTVGKWKVTAIHRKDSPSSWWFVTIEIWPEEVRTIGNFPALLAAGQ